MKKEYKGYEYEQNEKGLYDVLTKEGKKWIVDFKTEEDVKAQIDDIIASEEKRGEPTIEDQVTDLQLAVAELAEMIGGNE